MTRYHALVLAAVFCIGAVGFIGPQPWDWEYCFYPALVELAHGRSPYTVPGVFTPPWGLALLAPLGWLPYPVAKSLFGGLMLAAFVYVPLRLGFRWWVAVLYLLSPPVVFCLWWGNLEWLVLLGLVLPPPLAIPFYLVKPHVGLAMAAYTAVTQKGGVWNVCPALILTAVSIWAFPDWLPNITPNLEWPFNLSLWRISPVLSVGIGLALLGYAVWRRKREWALIAGPFFSPHLAIYAWSGAMLGLALWIASKGSSDAGKSTASLLVTGRTSE